MEVVVNVHVGLTTTSEESQLGVITWPKQKLIASETIRPAPNIEEVVVAKSYASQQQLRTCSHTQM